MKTKKKQNLFPLSHQDDHPSSDRQAQDDAQQTEGIPSEIHPAVFLNQFSSTNHSPSTTTD